MRLVVKVGSSSLCQQDGRISDARIQALTEQLRDLYQYGHEVLLVSSGAVAAGVGHYGHRPQSVTEKQALAAIGQAKLLEAYQSHLEDVVLGQVLVTRGDLEDPVRRASSCNTLNKLLEWRVLPIINENDTVADEEIRIGDNDTLAARVAVLVQAHLLVILSDIDGLYTDNPRLYPDAQRISKVPWVSADHLSRFSSGPGEWGTGGMATKLDAARIAQEEGIEMVLAASDEPQVLQKILQIDWHGGTRFLAQRGSCGA